MSGILKQQPLKLKGEPGKLPEKKERPALDEKIPWVEHPEQMPEGWTDDVVTIDQLADYLVIFNEVVERQSRYDEGVYILARITVDEQPFILRTGSKAVVGSALHMVHLDKVPFRALVEHRKGKWPGGYYCLSSPEAKDKEAT